jgi:hypothetical protein
MSIIQIQFLDDYWGDQIERNDTGGPYGQGGTAKKCLQSFIFEN